MEISEIPDGKVARRKAPHSMCCGRIRKRSNAAVLQLSGTEVRCGVCVGAGARISAGGGGGSVGTKEDSVAAAECRADPDRFPEVKSAALSEFPCRRMRHWTRTHCRSRRLCRRVPLADNGGRKVATTCPSTVPEACASILQPSFRSGCLLNSRAHHQGVHVPVAQTGEA